MIDNVFAGMLSLYTTTTTTTVILALVLSLRVVMGWVSSLGYNIWVSTQLHRPAQPGHPFIRACNEYWPLQMYCLARNTLVLPG